MVAMFQKVDNGVGEDLVNYKMRDFIKRLFDLLPVFPLPDLPLKIGGCSRREKKN